jgi:hypothetical protein
MPFSLQSQTQNFAVKRAMLHHTDNFRMGVVGDAAVGVGWCLLLDHLNAVQHLKPSVINQK